MITSHAQRVALVVAAVAVAIGCDERPSSSRSDATADRDAAADAAGPGSDGSAAADVTPDHDRGGPGQDRSLPDQAAQSDHGDPVGGGIAARYPGDEGIENDPDVVFAENFEAGSVAGFLSRYEDHKNQAGMALVADVPARSAGKSSLRLTAGGGGATATDFYKLLSPGHEELYVRYYAKYDSGVIWHHTGVWFGGYNPAQNWPSPMAGTRPDGDDRFSVSIEPMGAGANPGPRLDFYNYWMKMHASTAYWGNTLIHRQGFTVDNDAWMCIEIHVKLNPDPSSGAGAELAVWKNDALVERFTDQAPLGYWLKDKFCPQSADSSECTDYPPSASTPIVPLDLQYRSTTQLKLNYLWPQNYVTDGSAGSVYYDDLVVARSRVGCLR